MPSFVHVLSEKQLLLCNAKYWIWGPVWREKFFHETLKRHILGWFHAFWDIVGADPFTMASSCSASQMPHFLFITVWYNSALTYLIYTNRYNGQYIGNTNPSMSGEIWLDNVQCRGNETDFTQCTHAGWGPHNRSHSKDVSISCFSDSSRQHAGQMFTCQMSFWFTDYRNIGCFKIYTSIYTVSQK